MRDLIRLTDLQLSEIYEIFNIADKEKSFIVITERTGTS